MSSPQKRRWAHLNKVLNSSGPFVQAEFNPELGVSILADLKILVVGAGGLGCEILKDLSMMGFVNIHVIDCDTIDLSNLNRQFLFRTKDIGRPKAVVAAEFINNRVKGCQVVSHYCRIETKDLSFYNQFNIIVCGLDAIEPRRWLNNTIFSLLVPTSSGSMDGVIPLVDGGTEGFKGNARIIIPTLDYPCIECTLDLYPPRITFPLCTITQRPRLPEHCIEYVRMVRWRKDLPFGDVQLDGDDPTHLQWVFEKSVERAKEFDIEGVTYRLTQGVVKHIIPAVASTNAVIAAACVTEVFKLATASAPYLNNYLVFNDLEGIYTYTYQAERKPDCVVCSNLPINLTIIPQTKLSSFIEQMERDYAMERPTITSTDNATGDPVTLYMSNLHQQLGANLAKTLDELGVLSGQHLSVTDRQQSKTFIVKF